MKSFKGLGAAVFILAFLSVPAVSLAYDNSPSATVIFPEVIWAAATGGGTWSTDIQFYTRNGTNPISYTVYFMPQGEAGFWGPFTMTGPDVQRLLLYVNFLSFVDSWDTNASHVYYGKVGAIWIDTNGGATILAQAKTKHTGGYGKTFNGLNWLGDSNSAIYSPWRGMMIQNVSNTSTERTSIGLFNASSSSITVRVALIWYNDSWLGYEDITLAGYQFLSFNPFTRFGVSGTYQVCRVWIDPIGGSGQCMAYGALANNTTNDPSALVAVQYD